MGLSAVDSALRRGLGLGVKPISNYFKVYRIGGTSGVPNAAHSVVDPLNLINSSYQARLTPSVKRELFEQEPIYKLIYNGMCDSRQLKIGDVLVETGPSLTDTPDGRMFTFANVQGLLPAMFVRTEIAGSLSRPNDASQEEEPILGLADFQGTSKVNEWLYTLVEGLYEIQPTGVVAVIPMGLQPYQRVGSSQELGKDGTPTATKRSIHYAYIPNIGINIQPGDVISDQLGNRYICQNISSFTTGLQGNLIICESVFI